MHRNQRTVLLDKRLKALEAVVGDASVHQQLAAGVLHALGEHSEERGLPANHQDMSSCNFPESSTTWNDLTLRQKDPSTG
jgi:hypothetical protein